MRHFISVVVFVYFLNFHLMSCTRPPVKADGAHFKDSTVLSYDSFGLSGHSYLKFMNYNGDFDILHNPDCYCRYNRTFVIIKRGKQ